MAQRGRIALIVAALLLVAAAVFGCSQNRTVTPKPTGRPSEPAAADLTSPQAAVESYLDWISYAYRIGASDVASHTMSPEEGVRVDSYVQLNKEQGRLIEQRLVSFDARPASVESTHALVGAREKWEYRYVSAQDAAAATPVRSVSYETTYTVIEIEPGTWVVDSVEARALSEVR